jgi:hypothetical protein
MRFALAETPLFGPFVLSLIDPQHVLSILPLPLPRSCYPILVVGQLLIDEMGLFSQGNKLSPVKAIALLDLRSLLYRNEGLGKTQSYR